MNDDAKMLFFTLFVSDQKKNKKHLPQTADTPIQAGHRDILIFIGKHASKLVDNEKNVKIKMSPKKVDVSNSDCKTSYLILNWKSKD